MGVIFFLLDPAPETPLYQDPDTDPDPEHRLEAERRPNYPRFLDGGYQDHHKRESGLYRMVPNTFQCVNVAECDGQLCELIEAEVELGELAQ